MSTVTVTAKETKDLFVEVKSVFEHRCLHCHNEQQRKGDFSLQSQSSILESGMIETGDPSSSHLLTLIQGEGDEQPSMPKGAVALSNKEVTVIKEWIKQGASWPTGLRLESPVVQDYNWWSFLPINPQPVPQFSKGESFENWPRNRIDHFVLAKLKEKNLSPNGEANRRTLIRRVSYDLVGLPPSPEAIEKFVNDADPLAYEKLVDQLLASKHYGERWARHWLDVVKYADTCGYDKDKLRPNAWPYRDYVIRSFNQDKPYSQFVKEQVAGDVLFPGKEDGILGLGFIAAGPWDFIGHVEVPESKLDGQVARNLDRDEMLSSTINTFMSLTVQCARCHNHKFDPITQKDYYGMQAIFAAVDRAERVYDLDPSIEKQRLALTQNLATENQEKKNLEAALQKAGGEQLTQLNQKIKQLQLQSELKTKQPQFGYHSLIVKKQNEEKWVQVDLGKQVELNTVILNPCHDDYAGIGAGFGFPIRFKVEVSRDNSFDDSIMVFDQTKKDFKNPGLDPLMIPLDLKKARFIRVTAIQLSERSNDFIFALSELQAFDSTSQNVALGALVQSKDSIQAPVRWARKNLTDGIWPVVKNASAAIELAKLRQQRTMLMSEIETPERVQQRDTLVKAIKDIEQQLSKLPKGKMVYAAASHFKPQGSFKPTGGTPRPIRLLHRGNIKAKGELVSPALLNVSNSLDGELQLPTDHTEGERRAALANWLVQKKNPLSWRSVVNRIWLHHFGQGLVNSPNDFGRMGQLPTHPKLLDYLALQFRDQGQSFKQFHRMIVTSATYRQSSEFDETKQQIDNGNQYLWRMNRRRLEAEEIRDSILSVSGKLNAKMGGPGFYQFVLEKTAHSPHYEYHKFDPTDSASHRRSVYRFIVRSSPDPYMTTLDCADSSQSTPQRDETVTSLQALSLLNNRFNLTMAEYFAQRLKKERETVEAQVHRGFQLSTGRDPTADEQLKLNQYAQKHGLANYCRLLFNLNEFVYLD